MKRTARKLLRRDTVRQSAKQARYRKRQREGLSCYVLNLPEVELVEMLRGSELLLDVIEPDRLQISAALQTVVMDMIANHLAYVTRNDTAF